MGPSSLLSGRASDARTIAASLSQPERFSAIFDRHYDAVHGYLSRRVGAVAADDLAAATFTLAFERRGTFRPDATSARPWLYGIATNLLREQWRAEQRGGLMLSRLQVDASRAPGLSGPDVASTLDESLAAALAVIDPDQLTVLLLVAWEGLSYGEIADALELPVGTVRSRLSRGRRQLAALLGEGGDGLKEIEEQESSR